MKNLNYNVICIGIDESYQDTGITVNFDNGKKISCKSIKRRKKESKTDYRKRLTNTLTELFLTLRTRYIAEVIVVLERIRQFSGKFISMNYITSMSGLVTYIIDIAYESEIETYSVDTRNWKANIVGTSKPIANKKNIDAKKYATYKWCIEKGYKKYVMENGKYNDNIGDSIAISFSYWNTKVHSKLKEET